MPVIVTSILSLIQYAPAAINEIMALYAVVRKDLSATDQATIDAALQAAQQGDADATAKADKALDDAANR